MKLPLKQTSRESFLLSVAIVVGSMLAAVVASRMQPGVTELGYSLLQSAIEIAHGNGLGTNYQWPPGYSLLVAVWEVAGLTPLYAGAAVSLLAFGFAAACVFHLAWRITGLTGGLIAAALFASNSVLIRWAVMSMTEMIFTLSMVLAVLVFDWYLVNFEKPYSKTKRYCIAMSVGVSIAAPFWFRYVGAAVTGSAILYLMYMVWNLPSRKREALLLMSAVALVILPLPIRNVLFIGSFSWHPLTAVPDDTIVSATIKLMEQLRISLSATFPIAIANYAVLIFAILVSVLLVRAAVRDPRVRLVALALPAYILFFAIIFSRTFIDPVSERYLFPVFPFIFVAAAVAWREAGLLLTVRYNWQRFTRGAGLLLMIIVLAKSSLFIVQGFTPPTAKYSPVTLQKMREVVPAGSTVYGNRWAIQIAAVTQDYRFVYIPFASYLTTIYGAKLWSKKEMLDHMVNDKVRYLVFCIGSDGAEPFLESGAYGEYVGQIVRFGGPEVKSVTRLPDGMIIELADPETLRNIAARS